ncbi:hypothetical protein [Chelatococcus sp.]|uniref:hypothetical protein n=1 Tax=Chelatococcus sp. TaxID=1953771 RepID=UPI001EC3A079|nr:hypothetical protein [Chelatococcus sp.]MBX3543600.1 hypothetical protein [Chelatococcus sp.]
MDQIPTRFAIEGMLASRKQRAITVRFLRERALKLSGAERASVESLADLFQHADKPYPEVVDPWWELVPYRWQQDVEARGGVGSAGQQCVEN